MELDVSPCPFERAQKALSGKWSLLIVRILLDGPLRFNQLQRLLGDVAPGTLTKHLKTLEEARLVVRHSYDQVPPRVEYALTPLGADLEPLVREFERWSARYAVACR